MASLESLGIPSRPISGLSTLAQLAAGQMLTVQTDEGLKLIEADAVFKELFTLFCGDDSAQAHNGIFRGKDLTDVYTIEELHTKVSAGDFTDLFIGDYIDVSITTSYGGTETVRLRIAAFDYFLHCGSTEVTAHHIVFVPEDAFVTAAAMNSSNTTAGGYTGSEMFTTVLPVYQTALNAALGGHILTHSRYLSTTVSTTADSAAGAGLVGSTTACAWTDVKLCLMSEAMIYGCAPFSSSGRDVSDACNILPLFQFAPDMRRCYKGHKSGSRVYFWLCAVVSTAFFALCASSGFASCYSASLALGVRPYLLFS